MTLKHVNGCWWINIFAGVRDYRLITEGRGRGKSIFRPVPEISWTIDLSVENNGADDLVIEISRVPIDASGYELIVLWGILRGI